MAHGEASGASTGGGKAADASARAEQEDLNLLKRAEAALAEIDRTAGLENRHADVLAALRIRIEGGPRRSLEQLMEAAGDIQGRKARELDEKLRSEAER